MIVLILGLLFPYTAQADEFNIDLTGYELHSFGSFNQLGYEITPLSQLYFRIIQKEEEWIDEPRLYTKGNNGYFHLWKKDGTNVLYQVEKQSNGMWEIIGEKRKNIDRIPVPKTLLKEVLIERLVEPISEAIHDYYGESKLWYRSFEKVLDIKKDERSFIYYITVQVVTFQGPHNPPYGEETIRFQIKGRDVEVIDYNHRDISSEESARLELR
ncbi:DUF3888 domain-containing protein [Aquibacillus albus]|nr:DUF3888 domain-containing protein [Aquibacillus albus]